MSYDDTLDSYVFMGKSVNEGVHWAIREAITRTRKAMETEIAEKDATIKALTAMVARRDAGFKQGIRFGRGV